MHNKQLILLPVLAFLILTSCASGNISQRHADRYFNLKEYAKAEVEYKNVLQENGSSFDVYYSLGECAYHQLHWEDACLNFNKAKELQPDFPDTYLRLGECYQKLDQPFNMRDALEKLLELDKKNLKGYKMLADHYYETETYDRAESLYRSYLEEKPDDVGIRTSLGATLIGLKRYRSAISELEEAVKLDPKHINARYNLGIAYLGAKQNDNALRQFIVVTEISPEFVEGYINLAATYTRLGDSLRAIEVLERAREHGFSDWIRIRDDADFRPLLEHDRFQALISP